MTWKARAACADTPTAIFYPEPGDSPAVAYAVCKACPVRAECSQAGEQEQFGIWGGRSAASLRRRRRHAKRNTPVETRPEP
jgi:WhiB family redox-sensing transcriptional regulator